MVFIAEFVIFEYNDIIYSLYLVLCIFLGGSFSELETVYVLFMLVRIISLLLNQFPLESSGLC